MNESVSINSLFDEQVESHPDSIAISFEGESLSYSELNRQADLIANHLLGLGATPGNIIGIILERSLEMVVALMAVVKANAAYLVMDPSYPQERLRYLLDNAAVSILIGDQQACTLDIGSDTVIVDPIKFLCENKQKVVTGPLCSSDNICDNIAYIMYTSGSTGRPKGVMMSHMCILNYVHSINHLIQVDANDIYLHTASFSFSSSVRQLFVPILHGAQVVIASKNQQRSLIDLLGLIKDYNVTIIDTVQSVWKYGLLELAGMKTAKRKGLLANKLRLIIFSGDMLPVKVLHDLRCSFVKSPQVINLYGQTETIGGCANIVPDDFTQIGGYVPIGYPLAHYNIHILNQDLSLVKNGEPGEMYASGNSLSAGYLNNRELNEKYFINNVRRLNLPHRLYRTGDLGRYNSKGALEVLGRVDFQVKIKGVRIELSEIETSIAEHKNVSEVVVIAGQNPSGEKILVAYIVPKQGGEVAPGEIKRFLSGKLPDSMLPTAVVVLTTLPLTANGKVSRRHLPKPDWTAIIDENYHSPRNDIENHLAHLYAQLLGVKRVGITDSFFDLGGDSLDAVRLLGMIDKVCNKFVPLETIYFAPTIRELAVQVELADVSEPWRRMVNLQPLGERPPFFCVHGNDANFFLPKHLGQNYPFYGFFHQGNDGSPMQYKFIDEIASHYLKELRAEKPTGPYLLCGYSIGGLIAYEMAQQLTQIGAEVGLLVLIDTSSPTVTERVLKGDYRFDSSMQKFNQKTGVCTSSANSENSRSSTYFYKAKKICKKILPLTKKIGKLREFFERIIPLIYFANGRKLPLSLRSKYIMNTYYKARLRYKPGKYSGRVHLLRSTIDNRDDYYLGWKNLVCGELIVQEIVGDHSTIIREPQVQILATAIKDLIDEC